MLRRRISAIFLSCSLFVLLHAASGFSQTREPWDVAALAGDPDAIRTAAASVTADKNANITVLFETTTITFDKDRKATSVFHLVYRVENQQGVEGWDSIESEYQPWFEQKPQILARVIAPDGHVSILDQRTLTEGPARESEEDTFVDDRVVKGPLPGVAAGVIVEQEITQAEHQPFFSAGVAWTIPFGRGVPVHHSRLTLSAPEGVPLRYKTHGLPDVTAEKDTKDGVVTVVFDQGSIPALPPIPEMLPGDVPRRPDVEIATGDSWKAIADSYATLAESQIRPPDVGPLLPAAPSADRMALITQLVMSLHKNVRYTGIEFGLNALEPVPPTEILHRHYGDCKDKAALLVSMLRAEKIPAYLALLSTSDLEDVDPGLPGMSRFNHAIVYVPPPVGSSDPGLWIDATAEFARVGDLPDADRGRRALVIGDNSSDLRMTPVATPKDNLLIETREFTLVEQGPAKVTETSESHGDVDEQYRSWFGGNENDNERKNLNDYVSNVYLSDKVDHFDHGDGRDLVTPFHLSLEMDKSKRGFSDLDEAVVAIRIENIWNRLPKWFTLDPPDAHKTDATAPEDQEPPRTADVVFDPFITEWHYRINIPTGFQVRALPTDQTISMGPASITEHFEKVSDHLVQATLRFDTGSGRYTPAEAMAVRHAVYDHHDDEAIMLRFQQTGAAQMAAGNVRGAFETYESLIAAHPNEALHHVQMAEALLDAGIGDKAWAEAKKATDLEPNSALAWRTRGWILQHSSIGVRFGPGFDWQGSAAAYRKAIDLDKTVIDSQLDLGVLYEFSATGQRYADADHLKDAVTVLRAARDRDRDAFNTANYVDNLLFDLLYSHQYDELRKELAKLPPDAARAKFAIAAAVATDGVQAGLKEADTANGDSKARNQALASAAQLLIHLRLYSQAAEILSAGLQSDTDAAQSARQVEVFRNLQPYEKNLFPVTDPRSAVQRFFVLGFSSGVTEQQAETLLSRNSFGSPKVRKHVMQTLKDAQASFQVSADNAELPSIVLEDVVLGGMHYAVQGNDTLGYDITAQPLGAQAQHMFVVKEGGTFKLLTTDPAGDDLAREVFDLLSQNRLDDARQWLDWSRDTVTKNGGEDSLGGPLLARFWSIGDKADLTRMKLAAAAMLAGSEEIRPWLSFIRDCGSHATTPDEQTNCELLLADSLAGVAIADALADSTELRELHMVSQRLLAANPDSVVALTLLSTADTGLKQWSDWQTAAQARLTRRPNDPEALRSLARNATEQHKFTQARQYMVQLQTAGKADASDLNSLAWDSLFEPNVDQAAIDAAQQGNMLTQNNNFSIMHTLACVYAENGRTKEAREVILNGMKAGNLIEPNDAAWYVFGRIDEQFGQFDAAAQAYRKVEKPEGYIGADDTWVLAQKRLAIIAAHPGAPVA